MHILTLGDKTKPAILMLNGTLCSGRGLKPLGSRLSDDYYVILPTYDGCDGSGNLYRDETTEAAKLLKWLKEKGIPGLALAHGTSMGAEVLMAFAVLAEKEGYPVKQYFFDGGPFFHFPKPMQFVMETKFLGFADAVKGRDDAQSVEKLASNPVIRKLIGDDAAPYRDMLADMVHVCQTADHISIRNMVRTCYSFGFPKMPPEVQKKFFFLWGEKELARKSEEKVRAAYPHAKYRIAPGYMHCGYQVCTPDEYIKDLRKLL